MLNLPAGLGSSEPFPDPFADIASLAMPSNLRRVLLLVEHLAATHGPFSSAIRRLYGYFVTEVMIEGLDEEKTQQWQDLLLNNYGIVPFTLTALTDYGTYGNSFISIEVPFDRFLVCKGSNCGRSVKLQYAMEDSRYRFSWSIPDFTLTCPNCKKRGVWKIDDQQKLDADKIYLKRWSPHEMDLLHDKKSDKSEYRWRIPEDYKSQLRKGYVHVLETAPEEVLHAVAGNKLFAFNKDVIFHFCNPAPAGVQSRGWGIPLLLQHFRQMYRLQTLQRFNEAIVLDYLMPLRIISPASRPGSGAGGGMSVDPLMSMSGMNVRNELENMIRRQRSDPAAWNVSPFPVNYQLVGGEAKQLIPTELIDQNYNNLMLDMGVPIEMYRGTTQFQASPVALRLMQSEHASIVHQIDKFVRWVTKNTALLLSWQEPKASIKPVRLADDIQQQMLGLQLMQGGQVSGRDGLAALNYDWTRQQKRLAEEAVIQAEFQAKTQKDVEQRGMTQQMAMTPPPGGAPPGGAPPAGGGGGGGAPPQGQPQGPPDTVSMYLQQMSDGSPISPEDMMSAAQAIADDLLGRPEADKNMKLRQLRENKPPLHQLVRSAMDQKKRQAKSQAGSQAMAQPQPGGQPPA